MSRKAAKAAIDLYFDVRSPYSWIAFESLIRYKTVWPIELRLQPALLGGILRDADNLSGPQVNNKLKTEHMFRDLLLLGDYWQIPFRIPADPISSIVKQSTVLPLRFLVALQDSKQVEAAARRFWQRVWNLDQPIALEEHVRQVAKDVGISNVDEVLKKAGSGDVKEKLKTNSDAVCASGGYGLPWTTVNLVNGEKHQFFGSDRLHVIGHLIGEKFYGPLVEKAAGQ